MQFAPFLRFNFTELLLNFFEDLYKFETLDCSYKMYKNFGHSTNCSKILKNSVVLKCKVYLPPPPPPIQNAFSFDKQLSSWKIEQSKHSVYIFICFIKLSTYFQEFRFQMISFMQEGKLQIQFDS